VSRAGVLLDRDGTIIFDYGFVGTLDQVEFIPGVPDAILSFNKAGIPVAMVSNQEGVARGYYTMRQVDIVHRHIAKWLEPAMIDLYMYCPYHPDGIVPAFTRTSQDAKPNPGMAYAARDALDLDLSRSWMVGDRESDAGMARAAGMHAVMLGNPGPMLPGVYGERSLASAASMIIDRIREGENARK
jgi:D,D-heptose 1,7-bisphosphate phosphatase